MSGIRSGPKFSTFCKLEKLFTYIADFSLSAAKVVVFNFSIFVYLLALQSQHVLKFSNLRAVNVYRFFYEASATYSFLRIVINNCHEDNEGSAQV